MSLSISTNNAGYTPSATTSYDATNAAAGATGTSSGTTSGTTSSSGTGSATSTKTDAPKEADVLPDSLTGGAAGTNQNSTALKDQFLRLLIAQIQYQDPLAPQDGTAYISQLATLSQVEMSSEANQRLADLQDAQASSLRAGYANLVGRTIEAKVDTIHSPPGDATMVFELNSVPANARVEILDKDGKVVRTITQKELSKHFEVQWDGKDDKGTPVADGDYTFRVKATDSKAASIDAETLLRGAVTSVSYADGAVQLLIGSTPVTPGSIENIAR